MSSNNIVSGFIALIVAVVVAVSVVSFSKEEATVPSDQNTTGVTQVAPGEFPEGALLGNAYAKYVTGTIGAGVNQIAYRNTSGRTQYVDLASMTTSGTASTTQRVTAGLSTTASIADFTLPSYTASSLINYVVATSTAATTTSSVHSAATNGRPGVIAIPDGQYLVFAVTQTFVQSNCSGSVCETATSTNRGFNVDVIARVLQVKDR